MKLTNPFMDMVDGSGGVGSIPSGKGHLYGDALFNADFFQLQNTDGEEIIKYTKEDGLVISGGGGGESPFYTLVQGALDFPSLQQILSDMEAGKIPILFYNGMVFCQPVRITHSDTNAIMGVQWTAMTTMFSVGVATAINTQWVIQATLQNDTLSGMDPEVEYDPNSDAWVSGIYLVQCAPFGE